MAVIHAVKLLVSAPHIVHSIIIDSVRLILDLAAYFGRSYPYFCEVVFNLHGRVVTVSA